jgi:hypothetical protein
MTPNTPLGTDGLDAEGGESEPLAFADFVADLSRRGFLRSSAVAGLGLATLGGTAGVASAQRYRADDEIEDLLNLALTVERLQADLYDTAVGNRGEFSETDVERSDVAANFASNSLRYSVFNHLVDMRDHQNRHVQLLENALDDLRLDDTAPTRFSFPDGVFDDVASFVDFARTVENIGVAAYAGIAPELIRAELDLVDDDIEDLELTPVALGIHSVEARHAGYLRTLMERRPWNTGRNGAVDEAIDPDQLSSAIRRYEDR